MACPINIGESTDGGGDGIVMDLTEPLPAPLSTTVRPGSLQSSMFKLVTSERQSCGFLSGATMAIGDLRLNYGCGSSGKLGLWGDPDKSKPEWTIMQGPYTAKLRSQLHRVAIAKALV